MRYVITHGHIFKNAGTTFDWSLQKIFAERFLDHREDQLMREQGAEHMRQLLKERVDLVALSSHHLSQPLPDIKNVCLLPVYFIRHPIERIASVYEFERRQDAQTPGALAAKDKSFSDYVAWRMLPSVGGTIRNYQTLYLAGGNRDASRSEPGMRLFGQALQSVQDAHHIGLVDRYDESMVLLEQSLSPYFPDIDLSYIRQNVTRRIGPSKLEDKIARVFKKLGKHQQSVVDANSFDLALYQLVRQRMDAAIADCNGFEELLLDFRQRCDVLKSRKTKPRRPANRKKPARQ